MVFACPRALPLLVLLLNTLDVPVAGSWDGWQEAMAVHALARWRGRGGLNRLFCGSRSDSIKVWKKEGIRDRDVDLKNVVRDKGEEKGEADVGEGVYGGWVADGELEGHTGRVEALAIKDGKLLSGSADGTIRRWDCEKRVCEKVIDAHGDSVSSLAVWDEGACLLSGSLEGCVKAWGLDDLEHKFRFDETIHADGGDEEAPRVRCIALCKGEFLAAGCLDSTVWVWGLRDQRGEARLRGHTRPVVCLELSGGCLISGSLDGTMRVWGIGGDWECQSLIDTGGEPIKSLLSFWQGGKEMLLAGTDGLVNVYDAETFDKKRTLVHSSLKEDQDPSDEDEGEPGVGVLIQDPYVEDAAAASPSVRKALEMPIMQSEVKQQVWTGCDDGTIRSFAQDDLRCGWVLHNA